MNGYSQTEVISAQTEVISAQLTFLMPLKLVNLYEWVQPN